MAQVELVGAPEICPRISRDSYDAALSRGLSTAEALEVATGEGAMNIWDIVGNEHELILFEFEVSIKCH